MRSPALSPHPKHARGAHPSPHLPSPRGKRRCVGAFIWWAWGYGTAYHKADGDGNPFIGLPGKAHGSEGWVLGDESASGGDFASWWFQCAPHDRACPQTKMPPPSPFPLAPSDVFAATGATIVSGAMAERAQLGEARSRAPLLQTNHFCEPFLSQTLN